jgi:hypothetical protein
VETGKLRFQLMRQSSPDVVLGLREGTLGCPFFPPDFWEPVPEFRPWSGEREE